MLIAGGGNKNAPHQKCGAKEIIMKKHLLLLKEKGLPALSK